jgi:hypothetical protein
VWANTAEGGSDGTTVTTGNSGGSSGDAWNVVTIGTNEALTYSASAAFIGSLGYALTPSGNPGGTFLSWNTLTGSVYYTRFYVKISGNPAAALILQRFVNGTTVLGSLRLTTSGTLTLLYNASTSGGTTTNTIPADQWVRIEGKIDASGGTLEYRLYLDPSSSTPDETLSVSGVSFTLSTLTITRYGIAVAVSASVPTIHLDSIALSDVDWIGPSSVTVAVGPGAEVDGSGSVAASKLATATAVGETESATAVTAVRMAGVGQATSGDDARAVAPVRVVAVGTAGEVVSARLVAAVTVVAVAVAGEVGSAAVVAGSRGVPVRAVSSTETAGLARAVKAAAAGRAVETDVAYAVAQALPGAVPVGRAVSAEAAGAVTWWRLVSRGRLSTGPRPVRVAVVARPARIRVGERP